MAPLNDIRWALSQHYTKCQADDRSQCGEDGGDCPVFNGDYRDCPHAEKTPLICPECLSGGYLSRLSETPGGACFCPECDFAEENWTAEKNNKRLLEALPEALRILDAGASRIKTLEEEVQNLREELAAKRNEIAGLEYALSYRRAM